MKFIKSVSTITIKYFKGLFAIILLWLIPALGIFILDSCNKASYENSKSGEAARKFNERLQETETKLGSITLFNNDPSNQASFGNPEGAYYIKFPVGTNPTIINKARNMPTLTQITYALEYHNASINDSIQTDADFSIFIPEQEVMNTLVPLVNDAKNYLIAKGATQQQITDMLQEENAQEIDLIPFVKLLSNIEQGQYAIRKFSVPFVIDANAKLPKFIECGIYALGGDAGYALAHSGASSWTWSTMKSVFKGVAKRFLGPIGVAIAVISFTGCMLT